MGIYVNPGNYEFELALNDFIYIDKTELIAHTNDRLGRASRYLCVSRPRRFGKSMAADMLVAYYSRGCGSKELFAGKKIEKDPSFYQHLNQHNVIRIDVQNFISDEESLETFINDMQRAVVRELMREFPECDCLKADLRLQRALNEVFSQTNTRFIFVIDEWDCVFRMAKNSPVIQKRYLDFLRGLFKGTAYIDLVYMTGILPIKKYGEHSAVNMFDEYTMTDPKNLSRYFGFTSEEVLSQCEENQVDFQSMAEWYDGYLVDDLHIYNPKSVNDALVWKTFQSYWTGTETYDALKVYIERNFDGLKESIVEMLGGGACEVDTTSFQNDMTTFRSRDDILTLLVHLGYLTYDKASGCVSIPNREVKQEFLRAIKNGNGWNGLMASLDRSEQLLKDTWELNGDAVAAAIEEIHSETASWLQYHNENSLACVLYIAYYSASAYYAKPVSEMPTGKGRADIVYLPRKDVDRPALVVELKWDQSARGAIHQIKEKQYTTWVESYTGDILLIGINYDRATKKHSCIIEKQVRNQDL